MKAPFVLIALATTACSLLGSEDERAHAAGEVAAVPAPARPSFDLDIDDRPVTEAVAMLAVAVGQPVVSDPSATRYARCARITVVSPDARPVDELVTLVGHALQPSGFTLERLPEGLVLRHDGQTAPQGCTRRAEITPFPLPPPGTPPGEPLPPPEEMARMIHAVSDAEFLILDSATDRLFGNSSEVSRSLRIIPNMVGDEVRGLKVYGVRRNSLFGQLGILNGDSILTIHGRDVSSPDAALETYAALRGATRVEVVLERRGALRTHVYRIVDRLPRAR